MSQKKILNISQDITFFIFTIVLNNKMPTTNVFDETKEKIVLKRKKLSSQWKKKMMIVI
jgi:hypothetical protein